MGARRIAVMAIMLVALTALAANAETWAPSPSPFRGDAPKKNAAIGGMASTQTAFLGFVVAVLSFFTLKEFV